MTVLKKVFIFLLCIPLAALSIVLIGSISDLFYPFTTQYQPTNRSNGEAVYTAQVIVSEIFFNDDGAMVLNAKAPTISINSKELKALELSSVNMIQKTEKVPYTGLLRTVWKEETGQYVSMTIENPPVTPNVKSRALLEIFNDGCAYLSFAGKLEDRSEHVYTLCNQGCACEYIEKTEYKNTFSNKVTGGIFEMIINLEFKK